MMNARPANYTQISSSNHGSFYRSGMRGVRSLTGGMGQLDNAGLIDISTLPDIQVPLVTSQEMTEIQPVINAITAQGPIYTERGFRPGLNAALAIAPPGGLTDPVYWKNFIMANILPISIAGLAIFFLTGRSGRR